jgi:hypothetical protein
LLYSPGVCTIEGALQYWNGNRTFYNITVRSELDLLDAINSGITPDGSPVSTLGAFGDIGKNASGKIVSAAGLRMQYYIDGTVSASVTDTLQQSFLSAVQVSLTGATAYRWATRSYDDEVTQAQINDMNLVFGGCTIIAVLLCPLLWNAYDLANTRVALSFGAVALIVMGAVTGYGLCAALGVPYTILNVFLPLFLFGFGAHGKGYGSDSYLLIH